jgi:hypothetical protein
VTGPRPLDGDQAPSIHGPAKDVIWGGETLVPKEHLALLRSVRDVFPFTNSCEPFRVRVVSVFEPFADVDLGRVVLESLADEL